jgi:hypothetical protein
VTFVCVVYNNSTKVICVMEPILVSRSRQQRSMVGSLPKFRSPPSTPHDLVRHTFEFQSSIQSVNRPETYYCALGVME